MFLSPPPEDEKVRAIYEKELSEEGYVMNLERLWARRPEVRAAFVQARTLLNTQTSLSPRERAVLVCATARTLGDSYCALAWGGRLAKMSQPALAAQLLAAGTAESLSPRERALAAWAGRIVQDPNATGAGDVDALRQSGLSEQEIFDATLFIALRLAFSTVNDALGARPDAELAAEAPPEVRTAITYGRPVAEGRA